MSQTGKNTPHMDDVDKALEQLRDERMFTKETVRVWYRFLEYIVNLAELDGWVYCGHSFTYSLPMSRLVVRGTLEGIPHVVFSSGATATGCIRAFLRKMDEGWLEWSVDRFRQ